MSISSELARLQNIRTNIISALRQKGSGISTSAVLADIPQAILNLPGGGGSKLFVDYVTLSDNTEIKSYTITHNLGVTPNFCLIFRLNYYNADSDTLHFYINAKGVVSGTSVPGYMCYDTAAYAGATSISKNESTYRLTNFAPEGWAANNAYLRKNVPYLVIVAYDPAFD